MKIGLPGWFNVYTDALRDRVAENLGDLGGTIYNVANNAIDDTGKYVVSALSANPYFVYSGTFGETVRDAVDYGTLLDQAFNMGIGSVAQNVLKDQLYTIFDATDSGNPLLDAFHTNLKTNTADYVLDKGISYLLKNSTYYTALVEEMKRKGMDTKEAQEAAYYQLLLSSIK